MDAPKRFVQLGIRLLKFQQQINAGGCNRLQSSRDSVNFYSSVSSNSSGHQLGNRQISKLVKPQISRIVKPIGQRIEIAREANLSKFDFEILTPEMQERHLSLLKRGFESLRNDIEKNNDVLSHEIETTTAGFIKYWIIYPAFLPVVGIGIGMICKFANEE